MSQKIAMFIIIATFNQYKKAAEVTIEQGTLAGATHTSRSGRQFYAFLGIPFAKPPVDDLRFQPPQPPEPWNGTKDATVLPSVCIQNTMGLIGSEDCLYLNVYTPVKKSRASLVPVMVYIHGGGFMSGSSILHNPTYFMDHDVIVVTIAYRLHVLGFFSTGDDIVPGNNGMKDQVMALKWIQKNIAAFGGNPKQVTLFGNAAGGAAVHYHMYSPLSKGLFHQGILQSGSALSIWSHAQSKLIRERVQALGTLLNCPTENSQKFVNCLKKFSAEELLAAHNKLIVWGNSPLIRFPLVSESSTLEEAFINRSPWYQDELSKVPWMVGMVSNEGAAIIARYFSNNTKQFCYVNKNYERIWPLSICFRNWGELKEERSKQIVDSIKNFYFGEKNISPENWMEFSNLWSDAWFTYDIIESTKRHTDTKYFYYYDHKNEVSFSEPYGAPGRNLGVCHSDELISLFHLNGLFPETNEGADLKVSERMVKYWVNFATTGNPDLNGVWKPMTSDTVEYLHITTNKDEMKYGLLEDRFRFWKNLNFMPEK